MLNTDTTTLNTTSNYENTQGHSRKFARWLDAAVGLVHTAPVTATQVSRALGVSRPTAYALLSEIQALGYIDSVMVRLQGRGRPQTVYQWISASRRLNH